MPPSCIGRVRRLAAEGSIDLATEVSVDRMLSVSNRRLRFSPLPEAADKKKRRKKSVCSVFFYGERKKEQQLPPLPSCHTRRPFGFSQKGQLVQVFHFTVKRAIQAIHERFHSTSLRARILTPPLFSHQEFPFLHSPFVQRPYFSNFSPRPKGLRQATSFGAKRVSEGERGGGQGL